MRIGVIGDSHISSTRPLRRTDNYLDTLLRKIKQSTEIFDREGCDVIIQVGDLFDTHMVPNRVIVELGKLLDGGQPVLVIAGQHDLPGNSMTTYPNSPMSILTEFGIIELLDKCPRKVDRGLVQVYGASFGQDVPQVQNIAAFNVLVTHRMIGDTPIYPGQDITIPNAFLRNHPDFDLVLCGDYHYRFSSEFRGRWIINPGAMVRKSVDKRDLEHKPGVIVFDTGTKEHTLFELDVHPIDQVFDLKREIKTDNEKVRELVEALRGRENKCQGWKEMIPIVSRELDYPEKEILETLNSYMEEPK